MANKRESTPIGLIDDLVTPEITAKLARLRMQHVDTMSDAREIEFDDGLAIVSVSAPLVLKLRLKNAARNDAARLRRLRHNIAQHGYRGRHPIICRIGQKGKWIVVDGGHRLTAIRQLYGRHPWYVLARMAWRAARGLPWLSSIVRALFGEPDTLYCILFLGPRSNRLLKTKNA